MVKYMILMDDTPTESFSGMLQLIRYSHREEYLTIEYRDVPEIDNIDITKKPKLEVYEVAVNKDEIIRLRDFLNDIEFEDE